MHVSTRYLHTLHCPSFILGKKCVQELRIRYIAKVRNEFNLIIADLGGCCISINKMQLFSNGEFNQTVIYSAHIIILSKLIMGVFSSSVCAMYPPSELILPQERLRQLWQK